MSDEEKVLLKKLEPLKDVDLWLLAEAINQRCYEDGECAIIAWTEKGSITSIITRSPILITRLMSYLTKFYFDLNANNGKDHK